MEQSLTLKSADDLKLFVHKNYMNQVKNFFNSDKQAMKFLSSMVTTVQKNPALLECNSTSLINSFMTMAQLGLMPSDVSGEAYVLPYKTKNGTFAQFQLGYRGIITLFYRAGGQRVRSEIVREHDVFSYENGEIKHTIDIFKSNEERGEAVGAYAIADVGGHEIAKAMNKKDILAIGAKFSKSFKSEYSPWNQANDPEGTMWKKTVLKQLAKLLPQNETISQALAEDNKDSIIQDRLDAARKDSDSLKMGSVLLPETQTPVVETTAVEPPKVAPKKEETPAQKLMKQGYEASKKPPQQGTEDNEGDEQSYS